MLLLGLETYYLTKMSGQLYTCMLGQPVSVSYKVASKNTVFKNPVSAALPDAHPSTTHVIVSVAAVPKVLCSAVILWWFFTISG